MLKSLSTSLIVRGILAVAVGIVALAWPGVTVLALVILFAIYAFIAAGTEAVRAFSSETAGPVMGHLLLGLVDVGAAVIALAWPGPTALVLVLLVGAWAMVGRPGRDLRRLRGRRDSRNPRPLLRERADLDRLRDRPIRPSRHRRGDPGLAVRPVQPGLRDLGARAGHRPASGPPHSGLAGRRAAAARARPVSDQSCSSPSVLIRIPTPADPLRLRTSGTAGVKPGYDVERRRLM